VACLRGLRGRHMANKVSSQRDAVLWVWDTHNQVNERLAREEAATSTADPAFPKEQWPSVAACPPCRSHSLVHTDHASDDKPGACVGGSHGVAHGPKTTARGFCALPHRLFCDPPSGRIASRSLLSVRHETEG
jgi:hypothetical protein